MRMPIPFSTPPLKPEPSNNWWKTVPGQLAILVIAGGVVLIVCALLGGIGPHAGR